MQLDATSTGARCGDAEFCQIAQRTAGGKGIANWLRQIKERSHLCWLTVIIITTRRRATPPETSVNAQQGPDLRYYFMLHFSSSIVNVRPSLKHDYLISVSLCCLMSFYLSLLYRASIGQFVICTVKKSSFILSIVSMFASNRAFMKCLLRGHRIALTWVVFLSCGSNFCHLQIKTVVYFTVHVCFVCSDCLSFPSQCSPRNRDLIHHGSQISAALDHNMKDWRVCRLSEVEKLVWGENLVLSALVKVCSFLRAQCQSLWGTADRVNWSVMQYVHFSGRPTGCAKSSLRTASLFAGLPMTSKSHLVFL